MSKSASGTSYLSDMLGALLERPRQYLGAYRNGAVEALCTRLLAEETEVSTLQIASEILTCYGELDAEGRAAFFHHINDKLDVDPEKIAAAAANYRATSSPKSYRRLAKTTEPKRYEFLRRLNQPPGATAEIVHMRADLLRQIKSDPDLARSDTDFALMLRAWFNRGFLVLQQITWDTPASILEKIIEYKAVHEIETWDELRRRLHPADRRCFAFFHPAMPQEPLIFVEVALAKGVPNSIQDLLADHRKILEKGTADTAVFYSISNCQAGLAGISFGNSLIKQVVRDLSVELPNIQNFVTLSPIPGLRRWADGAGLPLEASDKKALRQIAAHYLLSAKNKSGLPTDPVARFHIQNGAQIKAVHAEADLSEKGLSNSFGVMVNYAYEDKQIAGNLKALADKKRVSASSSVSALARQGKQTAEKLSKVENN